MREAVRCERIRLSAASAVLAVLLVASLVPGCSSGSSSSIVGIVASFAGSGTAAAPDSVRLTGASAVDRVTVDIVVGGPTTSADLHSFAFELVLGNPGVAELVSGSAAFGDALTIAAGQQPEALATQSGNRITVGVAKLGGGSGNAVTSGEPAIVSLEFRVLQTGSTTLALDASPSASSAIDSNGATIGSVVLDVAPALISGASAGSILAADLVVFRNWIAANLTSNGNFEDNSPHPTAAIRCKLAR